MPCFVGLSASIGAQSDRENDIAICAIDHIKRVALLYPGCYQPSYHVYVFQDIKELFFISLTTNQKDILSKDSRAVSIWNTLSPLTSVEAGAIISQTRFISDSNGTWTIEIKSSTHTGTLVEATTENEDEYSGDRDHGASAQLMADSDKEETEYRMPVAADEERFIEEDETMKKELEKEYGAIESAKRDLARTEEEQMFKVRQITELKQQLARRVAELRKIETTTLPVKRQDVKSLDKKYYDKLKRHEDRKTAMNIQRQEGREIKTSLDEKV